MLLRKQHFHKLLCRVRGAFAEKSTLGGLLVCQFQRAPKTGIFEEGELRPDAEGLPP